MGLRRIFRKLLGKAKTAGKSEETKKPRAMETRREPPKTARSEPVDRKRREIEGTARQLESLIAGKQLRPEDIVRHLGELEKDLEENSAIARESDFTARIVLKIFKKCPERVRVSTTRPLLLLYFAKNPRVLRELPELLKKENNPKILRVFENVLHISESILELTRPRKR